MREIQKLFKPDTDAKLSPLPMTLPAEPTVVSAHVKGEDVRKDPSEKGHSTLWLPKLFNLLFLTTSCQRNSTAQPDVQTG